MIQPILKSLVAKPKIALLIISAIILVGGLTFRNMPIDAYPDISGVQVQLITAYPGKASEEVEQQVTIPLERDLSGVPRVTVVRSRSIFGLSLVQLLFEEGVEDNWARQVVFQKMSEANLPPEARTTMGSLSTQYGEIYRYTIAASKGQSSLDLRTIQDWTIVPRILKVPGVIEVANFGGKAKQLAVHLDPVKLLQYGIRLQEVFQAIRANNSSGGGSLLERGSSALVIRGLGRYETMQEIEEVFVKNSNGTPVFIHDLGKVVIDHLPQTGIFGINDQSDAIEGIVRMRRGENPSQVLVGLKKTIQELNADLAPDGIEIRPFYDRQNLVDNTLHTVAENVVLGILLVLVVLIVFLGNWKIGLLVSLAIPFSLSLSLICMKYLGIPLNLLSIGAIDFGIVVDGAIIVAEVLMIKLLGSSRSERGERTLNAFASVQKPLLISLGVIFISYGPLLSLSNIEGQLFRPMAITLCLALLGSAIYTVLLLPPLFGFLSEGDFEHRSPAWFAWLSARFRKHQHSLLKRTRRTVLGSMMITGALLVILGLRLGTEFLPYMDEGAFWIRASFPEGISLNENAKNANELRKIVREFPEIDFVSSQTGRTDTGTDPFPTNRVELMAGLKPRSAWRSGITKLKLENEIRAKLIQEFPTTRFNVTQPIIDSVTEDTNGTSANLAIEINGKDLDQLRQVAQGIEGIVSKIPGGVNVNLEQEDPQSQLQIKIDRARLATYHLAAGNINDVINTAIGGLPVSDFYDEEKHFDILVKYLPELVSSPKAIGLLPVFSEVGEAVPLGEAAQISVIDGETLIARSNNLRRITVRTDIRGVPQGSFVRAAKNAVAQKMIIPPGIKLEWLGMFENLSRSNRHFAFLIPFTLILVTVVLWLALGSIRSAVAILCTTLFSILGALLALTWRGIPFNVSVGVGFTSLFGISTMYGVLMSFALKSVGPDAALPEILDAVEKSFKPVLMTAAVAIIGLIPAVFASGVGSDIQRPIATSIVAGLTAGSILTLLTFPCFYRFFLRRRRQI